MIPLPEFLGSALHIRTAEDGDVAKTVAKPSKNAPKSPDAKSLQFWRLDRTKHASTWRSGEGAYLAGGRWSSRGTRVVYAALDPATAILEVAVHKGFNTLDTVPHTLISGGVADVGLVKVLHPGAFPNAAWLRPGLPSPNQQAFAEDHLKSHPVLVLPSVVSPHSWNVVIDVTATGMILDELSQERFSLDTRLVAPPESR